MKYEIIMAMTTRDLVKKVQHKIDNGFELLGGPFLNENKWPAQAIIFVNKKTKTVNEKEEKVKQF